MASSASQSESERPNNDLDALHRELIEARNLAIKTDNLVKNLGADIKQIARHQDAYQRKYLFNSAVAYVLFVAVIFTGLYMVFGARVSSYKAEVEHYEARNGLLQERLDDALSELERRREAEAQAYAFFELIQSGRREEAVEQFIEVQAQLSDRAMIELLRERVDEIAYALADEAYRLGLTYAQNEEWSEARDAFLASLGHIERTPWAPELYYNLGMVLAELEDYEGALHFLGLALETNELDEAHSANARYYTGLNLEETGRLAEAIDAFQTFRSEHPTHRYAGRALHHINSIQRTIDRNPQDATD